MEALLYIADDIQSLTDKKLLVVGLYSDRVIVFQRDPKDERLVPDGAAAPAVAQLCVLLTVIDFPPGTYEATIGFIGPDGKEYAKALGPSTVVAESGSGTNLVVKIAPFAAPMPGKYTVHAVIGGTVIERAFEVRFNYAPGPMPNQ